jgi:hypothetical protein
VGRVSVFDWVPLGLYGDGKTYAQPNFPLRVFIGIG